VKIVILIVLTSTGMDTQEFFDPSACERAKHELREMGVKRVICTPKRLVKP